MASIEDNIVMLTKSIENLAPKLSPFPFSRHVNLESVSNSCNKMDSSIVEDTITQYISAKRICDICGGKSEDLDVTFQVSVNAEKKRFKVSRIMATCDMCNSINNLSAALRTSALSMVDGGVHTDTISKTFSHFLNINDLDAEEAVNFSECICMAASLSTLTRDVDWSVSTSEDVIGSLMVIEDASKTPNKKKKLNGK